MTMFALHGVRLREGQTAKLSGGYADSAVPVYLRHQRVKVVGFGRTRVVVKLLDPEFADRQPLRVLPRTLVLEPERQPQKPLLNDEPLKGRQR
jgi:hypothetical protein